MKKIVLLIDSLTQGGAQRQIVGLASFLKERGYSVIVLTYHDIPFYAPFLDEHRVEHRIVPNANSPLKRIWNVRKALKQVQPDVVISYLDVPNMVACMAKMMGVKAKLIVSERNTTQHVTRNVRLKFFLYRWADHVVPNSMSQTKFIEKNFPSLSRKVTTISNFVDVQSFSPAEYHTYSNTLRVIGVGRIEPQKNILRFIESVASARNQGLDVSIDWFGRKSKDFGTYMEALVKNGLENLFCFHEPVNNLVEKYREADLFCLPSLYEGYPNVLCEAMACGLPVMCSNVCDNATIMRDGVNGFLFNPTDSTEITNVLMKFGKMSNEDMKKMATSSRQIAELRFCDDFFIDNYITLIE